jgi:CubicO group peptidase (beta-lactamase class C family)
VRPGLTVIVGFVIASSAAAIEPILVRPEVVDRLAADALSRWNAPGLAVVVVSGDGPTVAKGFGTKRHGTDDPITANTLFPLGSCTKAFTSALIARLAADGRLNWDDPVRKHLSDFHLSDPNADGLVTLRDLLTHRTGIEGHDLLWYRAPWDQDEVIRRTGKLPLTLPFRGAYHYTSLGYIAAGKAVALRAGRPWEELMRDRLTGPLGMTGAAFSTPEAAKAKDLASGHRRGPDGKPEPMPEYELPVPNPAGSLFATPRDLVGWLRFHLSGGLGPDGKRLVSAANLAETVTPHTIMRMTPEMRATYPATRQASYAMGWVVYDHRGELAIAHGGKIDGFRAQITLLPERKLGIALLNNLHDTKMNIALTNAIIDHALGLPPRDWNQHYLRVERDERDVKKAEIEARNRVRKPNTRPSLPLDSYVGRYEDAAYGTGTVKADGGRLVWEWSSFCCPLEHYQDDVFRITDGYFADALVEFAVNGGAATAVRTMGVVFGQK